MRIAGQPDAERQLNGALSAPVHAYLFEGPAGSGKKMAARVFAAGLIGGTDRDERLVLSGAHPDVREIERVGAAISAEQAEEVVRLSALAPIEGPRKVLILDEFHLLRAEAAARLLQTIEEPPASTVFIITADDVPPELVTIASRCARIRFRPLSADAIRQILLGEGVNDDRAADAATATAGNLDRARILAGDTGASIRRDAFAGVADRLDGTGAMVSDIVAELLGLIEAAAAPLAERQAREAAVLDERVKAMGERGSGRKTLEDRHKRELRRHRTDELKAGLTEIASSYRNRLTRGSSRRDRDMVAGVALVHEVIESLERNPNETLQLQRLLLRLPAL